MIVLTCGSVFDVRAIINFYLRVLCAPLPLSRLAVATVVSTVISSLIPFTPVHYTLNRLRAPPAWRLVRAARALISVFTDGQIAILAAIRPRRLPIYLVGLVGRVGIEPTVFPVCLIYSQVSSPTRRTDPYLIKGEPPERASRLHQPS